MKKIISMKTFLLFIASIVAFALVACQPPAGSVTPPAPIGPTAVALGTAGNYVILAETAISNSPTSAIVGEIGLSPAATAAITGFSLTLGTGYATSAQVNGRLYAADMAEPTPTNLTSAIGYLQAAYTDAAGRVMPDFTELGSGDIGGLTLGPGLYNWAGGVTILTTVTISGGANDTWIFQIGGTLNVTTSVQVILAGGAKAKNIIWVVAGATTIGTSAHFEGIILDQTAISLGANASVNGRLLAQSAVSLISNNITQPAP